MAYMVSNAERPTNHPIYSQDTELGSAILFNEGREESSNLQNPSFVPTQVQLEGRWNVSFDGVVCKEGARVGVWMQLPDGGALSYSYKLTDECTNNEAEYEALMLAIQMLKGFQVKKVLIHGDSKLVIKQLQGEYQAQHPRMRGYWNVVEDLVERFDECEFFLVPRLRNKVTESLATSVAVFKIPIHLSKKYEIEVRHTPFVPDNIMSWQVFEDDMHIQSFLHLEGEFKCLVIEESDSPLDAVLQSEEVESSLTTILK